MSREIDPEIEDALWAADEEITKLLHINADLLQALKAIRDYSGEPGAWMRTFAEAAIAKAEGTQP